MTNLYEVVVFAVFVLIVFIYLVGYWFSQISYYKEGFCIDTKCDIKIVNMQFKQLYSWIAFLLVRIDIIQKIVPAELDGTVEETPTPAIIEKYTEMYLTFEEFMVKIKDLYEKQNYIIKALQRFKPTESGKIPKFRKLTDQCFQLKSTNECGTEPVKKELVRIQGKLEEITFRIKSSYNVILQWEAFEKEYAELRKKTIADVNLNINDVMKQLGLPLPKLDISVGISKEDADKLKQGDYSAVQAAAKNNRELQQAAASTNSDTIMANADKKNPDNGAAIKSKSDGLVDGALAIDSPEATKAASNMGSAQDEAEIPSRFRH
jgi:hypothetical protein